MHHLVLEFLREQFEQSVDDLLDDTSHLFDEDSDRSVVKWITMYLYTAKELGFDFWEMVPRLGTPAEIENLKAIFVSHGLPWMPDRQKD